MKNSKEIEDNFVTGYRVKVIQEATRTCFSLKPQMLCGTKAKASKLIEKVVDFHCVTKSIASKHWEKMVQQGATPDFTQKGSNYRTTRQVPEKCEAL
ncbi:hypothetical protein OV760_28015 [Salmonella enterica subsp. enterica serovar 1,4,[5],12:i:-]|nr:hypothetical protein [Salmonella enterica subsp. enterica serovar 1,4,[5],12:i:-]